MSSPRSHPALPQAPDGTTSRSGRADQLPMTAPETLNLVDLCHGAYVFIYEYDLSHTGTRGTGTASEWGPSPSLGNFYHRLCRAIVLANLEVCMVHNIATKLRKQQHHQQHLHRPSSGQQRLTAAAAAAAAAGPNCAEPTYAAWEVDLASLNEGNMPYREFILTANNNALRISLGHVQSLLKTERDAALEAMVNVRQELVAAVTSNDAGRELGAGLERVASTFAAYRADLLGGENPRAPEGLRPVGPDCMAEMGLRLLLAVGEALKREEGVQDLPSYLLGKLFKAACVSGQCELVERLLDFQGDGGDGGRGTAEQPYSGAEVGCGAAAAMQHSRDARALAGDSDRRLLQSILKDTNVIDVVCWFRDACIGYHGDGSAGGVNVDQAFRGSAAFHRLRPEPPGLAQKGDWLDIDNQHSTDRQERIAVRLEEFAAARRAYDIGGGARGGSAGADGDGSGDHGDGGRHGDGREGGAGGEATEGLGGEHVQELERVLDARPRSVCKLLARVLLDAAGKFKAGRGLAVTSCRAALAADSLEAVEKAVDFLMFNRDTWPALSMRLLLLLSERFPAQAVKLLGAVELTPLSETAFGNVLPFGLRPGFRAIAISPHDQDSFGQQTKGGTCGRSLSIKGAQHFSHQTTNPTIEAALLLQPSAWLALLLLFDWREWRCPAMWQMLRVAFCVAAAFLFQGPGSFLVVVLGFVGLVVLGVLTRTAVLVVTLPLGLLNGIRTAILVVWRQRWRAENRSAVHPECGRTAAVASGFNNMAMGTERRRNAFLSGFDAPHNHLVDWLLGWGSRSTAIACQKVPLDVDYRHQLDSALLKTLLNAPGGAAPPYVFGSQLLRALIQFKWHYFTKYYIMMQLVLHLFYMAVFLMYAFSIKDLTPLPTGARTQLAAAAVSAHLHTTSKGDSDSDGNGYAGVSGIKFWAVGPPSCTLAPPTTLQFGYLCALGAITIDFAVQELRQLWHFGTRYFAQPWDVLDILSVVLMCSLVTSHFLCTLGPLLVGPGHLRGMAAGQVLLLFIRLLYYAMAFEQLGSFVRMVIATVKDLLVFAVFLMVVFVGFALAIIISMGSLSDGGNSWRAVFTKLFTMIYGDFDSDFLHHPWAEVEGPESGGLQLNMLVSVFLAVFMVVVTIILLNLLIAIVNESYDRIRANARWESLRNKALLIVSTEALLRRWGLWSPFLAAAGRGSDLFVDVIYTTLAAPLQPAAACNGSSGGEEGGGAAAATIRSDTKRYVYVITSERPRDKAARAADGTAAEGADAVGGAAADDDDGDAGGRLGEIRRVVADHAASTVARTRNITRQILREELQKLQQAAAAAAAAAAMAGPRQQRRSSHPLSTGSGADPLVVAEAAQAAAMAAAAVGGMSKLGEDELRRIAELVAESVVPRLQQQQQQGQAGLLTPVVRRPPLRQ